MSIKSSFSNLKLFAYEKAVLVYAILTGIVVCCIWSKADSPVLMLLCRLAFVAATLLLAMWNQSQDNKVSSFVRSFFQLTLLSYWYGETYYFNKLLPNLDHIFAQIDQSLFGFQPSIAFAEAVPFKWFNELMNLGYFSYFPMIFAACLVFYLSDKKKYDQVLTTILGSFFMFYVIFICVPVTGPQFYFPAIDYYNHPTEQFASVDDYFYTHSELQAGQVEDAYLFRNAVKLSQATGEKPTGAFPSSHVGVATILMLLLGYYKRKALPYFLPFYVLLVCATVYIKAHYFIDVVFGLLTGTLFFYFWKWRFRNTQ